MAVVALICVFFAFARRSPGAVRRPLEALLIGALGGALLRISVELMPGWTVIRSNGIIERNVEGFKRVWPIRACNVIEWVARRSAIRLEIDAVTPRGRPFRVAMVVPQKCADRVRQAFAEGMKSEWIDDRIVLGEVDVADPLSSEGGRPTLSYETSRRVPVTARPAFVGGIILICFALLVLLISGEAVLKGRPPRIMLGASVLAAVFALPGAFLIYRAVRQ